MKIIIGLFDPGFVLQVHRFAPPCLRYGTKMLGKTHMVIGTAAALAVMHPPNMRMLLLGTGAAAIGGVISDIDVGTSQSHKDMQKIFGLIVLAGVSVAAADYILHTEIWKSICNAQLLSGRIIGVLMFAAVCAAGMITPHRTFMHSLAAMLLLAISLNIMVPDVMPYFIIGFASHLAADCLNKKSIRLMYPLKKGFSLKLCSADGLVNNLLFTIGIVVSALQISLIIISGNFA